MTSTSTPNLERGIATLVEEFLANRVKHAPLPSVAERRAGYEASAVLAGDVPADIRVEERQVGDLTLRIYRRATQLNSDIALYYHGGCFVSGGFATHNQQLATLAMLSGSVVVAVSYRLAPEHPYPAAHDDAYEAAQWVYHNAALLGGDAQRITLLGDSAGGYLALATSLRLKRQGQWLPKQQILIYPMLDPTGSSGSYQTFGEDYVITKAMLMSGFELYAGQQMNRDELNLLKCDDLAGLPTTHIMTAECDPLRDEGELLYGLLSREGVEVHCQRYLGVIHGFFQLAGISPAARQCLRHVASLISL
ncbi:alpha/beta hydrolase [Vibrio furnissii]|uniref:alpha/beta hydrolase n=1 Tax=Vibrio furnissii TaxID=29494 RepID=UPI0025728F40|nr:alpha/beta hydrolase [Vibrio furnissii]WJG22950.1 alpha/beta hydrolase [Vibrio furnissii]